MDSARVIEYIIVFWGSIEVMVHQMETAIL